MSSPKGQFKAILLPWEALENYDDENECIVCISTRESVILKALLTTAYWTTRWTDLGETQKTLRERMARLDARLDVCTTVGGDSWIATIGLNDLFTKIFEMLWDGSPTDIHPDAPTVTWNTDNTDDRNAALCMASMALVDTIAAMEMQHLAWKYAGARLIFAVLKILIAGFAAFGVVVLGELLAELGYETAMAALADRQARLNVACCMYEALKGEAVTEAVLSDSLDACGFTPGTNSAIVRDYVHASIQHTETYYAMIDAAGRAFVQVSVLGLNLCECGDCGFCSFDLPFSDMPYVLEVGTLDIGGNPANCLHSEYIVPDPPFETEQAIHALFTLPSVSTVIKVTWDTFLTGSKTSINCGHRIWFFNESMEQVGYWDREAVEGKNEWHVSVNTGNVSLVKYMRIQYNLVDQLPSDWLMRLDNVRGFCS